MVAVLGNTRTVLYIGFALAACVYAFTSIEYFYGFDSKTLTLWDRLFAFLTSVEFAQETGSVHAEMHATYSANKLALQTHATTGSLMLIIGIFQFWTRFRIKLPKVHRWLGQLYVLLAIPTSGGALIYLASITPDTAYSGDVFYVALAGLAVATAFSTLMAYLTARRRDFQSHRAWMLQSYFYILSAPLLRMVWVFFYQIDNTMNQWDNNLYAVAPTTALIAFGPLVFWLLSVGRESLPKTGFIQNLIVYYAILKGGLILNILIALTIVLLLITYGSAVFDSVSIGIISVVLLLMLAISLLLLQKNAGVSLVYAAMLLGGIVAVVAGLTLPINTAFGPAFPSSFLTAGVMLLFALFMQGLMIRFEDYKLVLAWRIMGIGIVFAPVTVMLGSLVLIAIGWPIEYAVPGACLGAFFLNPLVAYALIIHRRQLTEI